MRFFYKDYVYRVRRGSNYHGTFESDNLPAKGPFFIKETRFRVFILNIEHFILVLTFLMKHGCTNTLVELSRNLCLKQQLNLYFFDYFI